MLPPGRKLSSIFRSEPRVVFTAAIAGEIYARHGTTIETRLTVIDKRPAADPAVFPCSPGIAPDAATLLAWVMASVPPRLPVSSASASGALAVNATARNMATRPLAARNKVPSHRGLFRSQVRAAKVPSSNSLMRPPTDRWKPRAASPTRSMNPTRCNRSG